MILTGPEIEREVRDRRIIIDPFCSAQVNPNSYNYHLANLIREVHSGSPPECIARPCAEPLAEIPAGGLTLLPDRLYLASTLERIGSEHYVTSLIGRSSLGRLGLFLQVSANLGHQGDIHNWTLELHCCHKLRIYPGMVIGQVVFWTTRGQASQPSGYYARFDVPMPFKEPDQ